MKKILLFIFALAFIIFLINLFTKPADNTSITYTPQLDTTSASSDPGNISPNDPQKSILNEIQSAFSTIELLKNKSTDLSIETMNSYIQLMNDVSATYIKSKKYNLLEVKQQSQKLKKELSSLQIKLFPKYRKAYASEIKQELWEQNIEVSFQNKSLTLTGGTFASNKNKKDVYEAMYPVLKNYRFKRISFKWYEYDDKYTYWNIDSPDDGIIE